jgi:hypothetical protein
MSPPHLHRWPVPFLAIGAAVWLSAAGAGLWYLARTASASTPTTAPAQWPATSTIGRTPGRAMLVMFIHPHCPCSSATLAELNRIIAKAPDRSDIVIAFYAPSSEPRDWGATSLRSRAAAIPAARAIDDVDAREATLFGAHDSGHVVLYDGLGRLRLRGGITPSRGHEGDNPGEDAVIDILSGRDPATESTPTFGCAIVTAEIREHCPLCREDAK